MTAITTPMNIGAFTFRVHITPTYAKIDATVNQSWIRVSGVISESEPMQYMQGTDSSVMTAPGRTTFADLELERVYQGVDDFYAWRIRIEQGYLELGDVKIEMLNRVGKPVRSMICKGAWPKKWQMPDLDASSSEVPIEKITLAVNTVIEEKVTAPTAEEGGLHGLPYIPPASTTT